METDRDKFLKALNNFDQSKTLNIMFEWRNEVIRLFDKYYRPFEKCKHLQSQGKCYACKDDKLDSKWCIKSSKIKELCKQFEEGK